MAAVAPIEPTVNVKYMGYENVGETDQVITKPIYNNEPAPQPSANRSQFQDIPYLTEDQAKEALTLYVESKCCYGSKPVKEMVFTNLESSNTFRYVLETFTETRSTSWVSEPYFGQPLLNTGMPPPQPWDIPCQPRALFNDESTKLEVPGTAYVKRCDSCYGSGYKSCWHCHGRGRQTCSSCGGSGHRHHDGHMDRCTWCHGSGYRSCIHCHGSGRITCSTCKGRGNLKCYIQLIVRYKNNLDDFIKKSESIPDDLIRACTAKTIFSEQDARIYPINHHPAQDVNNASTNLIQTHLSKFGNSRILYQRHSVLAIPVTLCSYTYKEKPFKYYVYGLNSQVYAQDYPAKCCCCTIL